MLDVSELLRPEPKFSDKEVSKFRDYTVDENDPLKERVRRTYKLMHTNQTVDFVKGKHCDFITQYRELQTDSATGLAVMIVAK